MTTFIGRRVAKPAEPTGGKMNGLRPPLTAPPVFTGGQSRGDSQSAAAPYIIKSNCHPATALYGGIRLYFVKYGTNCEGSTERAYCVIVSGDSCISLENHI